MKKLKQNKKILIAIAIIIVIIATIIFLSKNQTIQLTPELSRTQAYDEVKSGDKIIEETNGAVTFDAFFLIDRDGDGDAESVRGTCNEIGKRCSFVYGIKNIRAR